MNTLKNHVLIYDKDCPLCTLYTGAFIKANMLDENGRQDFCSIQPCTYPQIDDARSRDEIALVNTQTGHITYGIDSLFKILSNRFPILRLIFNQKFFHYAISKFYSFVSFNRKVIAPAKVFELSGSCTPSFNLKYRWAYIVLSWMFTSLVLSRFAVMLEPLVPSTNFFREWLICGGQIFSQSMIVSFMRRGRLVHYLGNMMTVSNMGALLLIPVFVIPVTSLTFSIAWLAVVLSLMLYEHSRRIKILELPVWVSVSWALYLMLILAIVLA